MHNSSRRDKGQLKAKKLKTVFIQHTVYKITLNWLEPRQSTYNGKVVSFYSWALAAYYSLQVGKMDLVWFDLIWCKSFIYNFIHNL